MSGPDRVRSIRSRLILGLLLPYVCLMGVGTVALFGGPAETNRIPAILVLLAAAVLLPLAMARIARGILRQTEALETERATLAAGQGVRDARADAVEETVAVAETDVPAAPAEEPTEDTPTDVVQALEAEAANADVATHEVADPATVEIDEDAPLAAATVGGEAVEPSADEVGPFAALVANAEARSIVAAGPVADSSSVASATEPAVEESEPGSGAEDLPHPVTAAAADEVTAESSTADPAQDAAPRPVLMPSAIGRQVLTDTPAEPAA